MEASGVERGRYEFPKVTDFGVARTYNTRSTTDLSGDIHDLGLRILYPLFTGSEPRFTSAADKIPVKPSVLRLSIPESIEDVIRSCCEARYRSMDEVADDLHNVVSVRYGVDVASPEQCVERDAVAFDHIFREALGDLVSNDSGSLAVQPSLPEDLRTHVERFGARQIVDKLGHVVVNVDWPHNIFNLAYAYAKLGEYAKAKAHYLEALSLCESGASSDQMLDLSVKIFHNLALLHQDVGDYAGAAEYFAKARAKTGKRGSSGRIMDNLK